MYVEFYEPAIFLIIVIIGCSFIMNLAFFLQKRNSFTWLSFLGKHSLYIYVAHVIAFAGVRILLTNLLGVDNLLILLITGILAGIIFPLVFYKLVIKMNVPWIFTLEKGNRMVQKEASESNPNPNKF
jgi:peptidoglycan/LPS O-acetylase OafA/YrhL